MSYSSISGIKLESYDFGFAMDQFLKSMLNLHFSGDLTKDSYKYTFSVTQGYQISAVEGTLSFAMNLDLIESSIGSNDASCFSRNVELIRASDIIVFVLDAPALIEKNGRWNESVNGGGELKDLCKHALTELNRNKLMILAPVKCESYLRDHAGCHQLLSAIENEYIGLFNFIEKFQEIAFAVTPVQTLGNVYLQTAPLTITL